MQKNRNQKVKFVQYKTPCIEICDIFPADSDRIPEHSGIKIMTLPEFYWYVYKRRDYKLLLSSYLKENLK